MISSFKMNNSIDSEMRDVRIVDVVALGQTRDVKILLQRGLSPNEKDEEGNHPVAIAAKRNDLDTLKVLVKAGAKVAVGDAMGMSALTHAQNHRNQEMMDLILSKLPSEVAAKKEKRRAALNKPLVLFPRFMSVDSLTFVQISPTDPWVRCSQEEFQSHHPDNFLY